MCKYEVQPLQQKKPEFNVEYQLTWTPKDMCKLINFVFYIPGPFGVTISIET